MVEFVLRVHLYVSRVLNQNIYFRDRRTNGNRHGRRTRPFHLSLSLECHIMPTAYSFVVQAKGVTPCMATSPRSFHSPSFASPLTMLSNFSLKPSLSPCSSNILTWLNVLTRSHSLSSVSHTVHAVLSSSTGVLKSFCTDGREKTSFQT